MKNKKFVTCSAETLIQQWDENWKKLTHNDETAKKNHTLVGRYITEPFADGQAVYVVVKEMTDTVRIKVCTGLGDDWEIPIWGKNAVVNKKYIKNKLQVRDRLSKYFAN